MTLLLTYYFLLIAFYTKKPPDGGSQIVPLSGIHWSTSLHLHGHLTKILLNRQVGRKHYICYNLWVSEDTELRLSPEGATFIDAGADSLVYRIGNEVVKVYKEQEIERIQLYKQITNKTADWLRIQAKVYQITIGGRTYSYSVSVNPITAVGEHPSFPGKVTSTAEYVPGPRLTDPFPPRVPFKNREFADPVSIQLEELSDQLNKQMGVKGILIVEPNVKFKYNPQKPEISLTVTDISSHIWSLSLPT